MDVDESELKQTQLNKNVDCCQRDPQPSSSNHKQQHENDDDQAESKRQRTQTPEQPLKITDLNDFCLERIFKPLNLRELFNVAVANARLRPVAYNVYQRKFGMKEVCVRNDRSETIYSDFDSISVVGLKTCLQYLRCLGASITNLHIHYGRWKDNECKFIHQYIGKYCAASLIQIKFDRKPKEISIDCFEKPFPNVHTVRIYRGDLGSQLSSLPKWFPNARTLHWDNVRMADHQIDAPFHHLQFADIAFGIDDSLQTAHLLRMCGQLQSLKIQQEHDFESKIPFDTLLNVIKSNPMICNLNVRGHGDDKIIVMSPDVERLINEHALLVELDLGEYVFTADDAIRLTQELNWLKEFRFQVKNRLQQERFVAQLDFPKWQLLYLEEKIPGGRRDILASTRELGPDPESVDFMLLRT